MPRFHTVAVAFYTKVIHGKRYREFLGSKTVPSLVLSMTPAPGERRQQFVGDRVRFALRSSSGPTMDPGWRALLRTNLGRAEQLRREIIQAHTQGLSLAGASWRDLPMLGGADGWSIELPLAEVGYFKAKAYLLDPNGWQHWPEGTDVGISVHPDQYRTGNILYCAFTRMFGGIRTAQSSQDRKLEETLAPLDSAGYTLIPPSGTLRDLIKQLPHIFKTLGCRILHLLPINPTPTTYARFGRYGSPYAALDLQTIDQALIDFDRRTTGIDQFRELTYQSHLLGGRVFLDLVINHTGWGSVLMEHHPEWFLRHADGTFASPGAWGVTWEDLVELKHQYVALWDELAETFLVWCRRGVDGFRCDAGYKVPVAAWQYIVARVRQEHPETIFLLEGLGGAWETTEALLTEGGLQWAYSELFQNYSGADIANYLAHSFKQSRRCGLLVHYSETHDNDRLAARSRDWSLLRNKLCALTSVSGGFGFTCGVEWLATEKIDVHGCAGMSWDSVENLVPELARLNQLLLNHPCFFDGATVRQFSTPNAQVYATWRESDTGQDALLVLVNTDVQRPGTLNLDASLFQNVAVGESASEVLREKSEDEGPTTTPEEQSPRARGLAEWLDLLGQPAPDIKQLADGKLAIALHAGAAYCMAPTAEPRGLHGDQYRRTRAKAAWGLTALSRILPVEQIGDFDWRVLAAEVDSSPSRFLSAASKLASDRATGATLPGQTGHPSHLSLHEFLAQLSNDNLFPCVVSWSRPDERRITLVPPGHWLLVEDTVPFRAALKVNTTGTALIENLESIAVGSGYIACFGPRQSAADATLSVERYSERDRQVQAAIRFLATEPELPQAVLHHPLAHNLVLLTNGRGGMARFCVDLGRVLSKYDCVLAANLHPEVPVDRHVFAKRIRVWVNADGFISPLDLRNLASLVPGPPAVWDFVASAGDGRTVEIRMAARMLDGQNTTLFCFSRPTAAQASGKQLPPQADVRLTVRLDIEDRNFHWETKRNGGAEYHFSTHTHLLAVAPARSPKAPANPNANPLAAGNDQFQGFAFTPAPDRQLRVFADSGSYHPAPEWSENLPHLVEQSRGQVGAGDAFSPGWFELPLPEGATVTVVATAEASDPEPHQVLPRGTASSSAAPGAAGVEDVFSNALIRAVRAFVVRRGKGKTVIAGYPWFLDWGRDTFICARGLLAAEMREEVKDLLLTFGRFEKNGTLPNTIMGEDASNRDTSDAPLWFGLVHEEYSAAVSPLSNIGPVLESIGSNYAKGTPNGIRMDPASGLVWSPAHFTWMDTNYPACTPREGYPVEIQALWVRLLRQLAQTGSSGRRDYWTGLAALASASLEKFFWREELGYYADVLLAKPGQPAAEAIVDDALRSNSLLVVSLGLSSGARARRCVEAARRHLVTPGALRSLAPLPVSVPVRLYDPDGRPLNDPHRPYWGRYEGDEDTRRKPAYHNGTGWTWTFPSFCEALARAWDFSPPAVAAARAYLGASARLLGESCLGQLPELLDGDAPHTPRGCDAQAWAVTEALRVWKVLREA
jgi:predicted glycogen debranching enzyme